MTETLTHTGRPAGGKSTTTGRLFVLELSGDRIHSMNPDGSNRRTIVTDCHLPDGIVVDAEAGHIYWTNMGIPNLDDGSIERANLNGSQAETLVETGRGDADRRDQTRWCVGITIDPQLGKIYWTQKGPTKGGLGRLCRANIDIPSGESPANRSDIEVLFGQLPEPIDLELDVASRVLYWTDRGDPPRGNTVNRIPIDDANAVPQILITHLMEGIGIALDVPGNRIFVTDFAGSVYSADLDGSNERNFLFAQGNLTGIAYAEI